MNILINNKEIAINNGETLLEAAMNAGFEIPTLCYAKGYEHKSSCMVCVVKNRINGQIIPSCSTFPVEGMSIETDSEEVCNIRKLSLELLLSDHRADCEAPCTMVCPKGLEVEQVLSHYDSERYSEAYKLITAVFEMPDIGCDTCKSPCEKACRRGTVDKAVSIREIIKQIVQTSLETQASAKSENYGQDTNMQTTNFQQDINKAISVQQHNTKSNDLFQSHLGRFTVIERERLKSITTPSRCLHCACSGSADCKLRQYATSEGIKRPRYEAKSALPAMNKQFIHGNMWFEQAKCIRCGLCVYNSQNGFTFKNRGFGMQIVLPDENQENVSEALVSLCPTGAIYSIKN